MAIMTHIHYYVQSFSIIMLVNMSSGLPNHILDLQIKVGTYIAQPNTLKFYSAILWGFCEPQLHDCQIHSC